MTQTHYPRYIPVHTSAEPDDAFPVAAIVCAFGYLLRILLSAPVLNVMGIDYGMDEAPMASKIHPGTYFIYLSFLILIFSRGNPLAMLVRIAREQTAFCAFVAIYLLIIVYWMLRGPKGIGLIFDEHIIAPLSAIVLSYAPRSYCKWIIYLFAGLGVANSMIGVFEAITHIRLFVFDPDWEVLKQDYFRSSALIGHPLANAVFTVLSLFVALSLRLAPMAKAVIVLLALAALVAFGGRSALGMCVFGLVILGLIEIRNYMAVSRLTVLQIVLGVGSFIIVPVVCFGLLFGLLHSSMGERLQAYNSLNDESANVRMLVFHVFDHMSAKDLIFGSDGDRTLDIASQVGLKNPTSDIENPWILMLMFLGAIMFPIWFCGLAAYIWRLISGASPAIKLAVLEYFMISTTSNSFGRKDLIFGAIGGLAVCAKRMQKTETGS